MIGASRRGGRKLFLTTAFVLTVVAWGADPAGSRAAESCRAVPGRTKVGAVTRIIHTSVFVDSRYAQTAPCDLFAGDELRTDSRGEAVVQLADRGRATICSVFQRARLRFYSRPTSLPVSSLRVITFSEAGRTWCSTKGSFKSPFVAVQAMLSTASSIFGVEIDRETVLIKVFSGTLHVSQAREVDVGPGKAILVSPTGMITGPRRARFDATDRLALARVS